MKINEELLDRAEELRLFACGSAGIGQLLLRALEERGITVTNASGVHGPNIAEHVIGWILMFTRRLDEGMRRKQLGVWKHFKAYELQG
jgi:phosphoglycerate dehydrogenase-like enzyme